MRIVTSAAAMQRSARRWRRNGIRVGLVPTMGYLHAGHLRLMQRARRAVGPKGIVAVSVYVNPTQFGRGEDLSRYPRDLPRDTALCRAAAVDVLFVPTDAEMYPGGLGQDDPAGFSTFIVEEALSRPMEGASRPTHFRGVTTVVGKLFNLVLPEVAVFGAKDFQQAAVVQRMVRDLNFPIRIVVEPTKREQDGLAMSSRNKYLTPEMRSEATVLWQAIRRARTIVGKSRKPIPARSLRNQLKRMIERNSLARVDYIEFFEPATLRAVSRIKRGDQLALAAFLGPTRLIDNGRMD